MSEILACQIGSRRVLPLGTVPHQLLDAGDYSRIEALEVSWSFVRALLYCVMDAKRTKWKAVYRGAQMN
jgi:hypothetical protein